MIQYMLTNVIGVVFVVFSVILSVSYIYVQKQYKYWSKKNVPHSKPSFPLGSLNGIQTENPANVFRKLYKEGKHNRYFGIWLFHKPGLLINDPDLIKQVLISEFTSFHDRGIYYHEKADPLSANLVTQEGEAWRNMRGRLSPAFTSGKIKNALPVIIKYSEEMKNILLEHAKNEESLEMADIAARFTTDVICAYAFGIEANSLKNPVADIRRMLQKSFGATSSASFRNITAILAPKLAEFFQISVNPREVSDYFFNLFREVLNHRDSNKRNDLFQLLLQHKDNGLVNNEKDELLDDKLTFEQIAAQAFIFLIGGFETSGLTIQYALYELSKNQNIQEKVRNEIRTTLKYYNGELTYESINKMEYLGRVIDETLRKYPPTPGLIRTTTKAYKVPDSDHIIEKGTPLIISTFGIHMDDKYYPNPEIFDPDRFTEDQKAARSSCTYLPFGEGPRICIGLRLALLEIRVGLITLLSNFKFSIPQEYESVTLKLNPRATFLSPKNGMNLKICLLKN